MQTPQNSILKGVCMEPKEPAEKRERERALLAEACGLLCIHTEIMPTQTDEESDEKNLGKLIQNNGSERSRYERI